MDYEDDIYDDFNSEHWEDSDYTDSDTDVDFDAAEGVELPSRPEQNYTVLSKDEIVRLQEDDLTRICSVLSVSRDSARILLHHYKWSLSEAQSEWFADNEKVRRTLGLLEKPVIDYTEYHRDHSTTTCGICFDRYDSDKMHAASCGHLFCSSCWEGYISVSVSDGPGCLSLRCPEPSCSAAVGGDMINLLASEELGKYSHYLLRSYIENNRKTKWCPAPDCDFAVAGDSATYDVTCPCSHSFCWNCSEEAHRPVDCETVSKWISKNSAEAQNTSWILAYSKPCPKCKRPIEKNEGCMHMTCGAPCRYQFCWLCLTAWKGHGDSTGGYMSCNHYEVARKEGAYDESEKQKQEAKESLKKYSHYFERWATNNSSRIKALADLRQVESVHLEALSVKLGQSETSLKFIVEAWQQIIECRRILKWTYAYGYYFEGEYAKKRYFEYVQGEAEACLERLHMCAEKDLRVFLDSKPTTDESPVKENPFSDFRAKLVDLTRITRTYFENLVRALEGGLLEFTNSAGSSSSETLVCGGRGMGKARGKRNISASPSEDELEYWYCDRCTYANASARTVCEMCHQGY